MSETDNTDSDIIEADNLALYQALVYGNDQLLMKMKKTRKSIDKTNEIPESDIKQQLSSAKKLILVHGYIKDKFLYFAQISNDIILLIYYFYDIKLQRSYLSPYYYRVFYISRPLGLAVCEKLETKYICMTMPNSPAGKLGLRAGSKLIAYNNYVFEEEDIKILNEQFAETQNKTFTVYKDVKRILMSNNCLPLTLYLKYDPIDLLEKIDESINNEANVNNCKFFHVLHNDTLQWAINGKVEYHKIVDINGSDVFSTLPIQSEFIQNNLQNKINDLSIDHDDMNNVKWNEITSECIQYDDTYFKIGHLECGEILKVYGKAGCYMYCVQPLQGWIKFVDTDNGNDMVVKCDDNDFVEELQLTDMDAMMSIDSKYHFKIAILTKYIRQNLLCEYLSNNFRDYESDEFDRYYNLMDILNAVENREKTMCFKVIYFMHTYTMTFVTSSKTTQEKHIKRLMDITDNKNVELIIITIQHNVSGDYNAKLPIIVNGIELKGYIVARAGYDIFDKYDLTNQVTSFRFGILMLGPNNQIFIKPKEVINDSIFRKIQYLIQGRRLSKISNLLNSSNKSLPFMHRTLSVETD
eukprot:461087_1